MGDDGGPLRKEEDRCLLAAVQLRVRRPLGPHAQPVDHRAVQVPQRYRVGCNLFKNIKMVPIM